jgi:hypothetical protein
MLVASCSVELLLLAEKTQIRGILRSADGTPKVLIGSVTRLKETYGFIRCEAMKLDAFLPIVDEDTQEMIGPYSTGSVIRFELGFTLRGPAVSQIHDE